MTRYAESLRWLERARKVTPGAAQTRSKRPEQFVEGAFPVFLERGWRATVRDVDGYDYVDFIAALGAIGLGYADREVTAAVGAAVLRGGTYSLPHPLEAAAAEVFLAHVAPWAEQVRWVKTGSEATEAAMRIARVATGRDVIVSIGYHGWHAVHDAAKSSHPGVPIQYTWVTYDHPYNDPCLRFESLEESHGAVAGVIMEPTLIEAPRPGYLQAVRDLCSRHGALLIFDEMVTGFRWALGGGTEYFGVTPDLACFGKAMGNGFPIACVTGPTDLMQHAVYASSTFGGDTVGLAAASATIQAYVERKTIATMWHRGSEFVDRTRPLLDRVPLMIDGYPVHPRFKATTGDAEQDTLIMSVFVQECAARGILIHPSGCNVIAALTDQDMDKAVHAVTGAVDVLRAVKGDYRAALKGLPIRPLFQRVTPSSGA